MANITVYVAGIKVTATSVKGAREISQAKLALESAIRAGEVAGVVYDLAANLTGALLDHGAGVTPVGAVKAPKLVLHKTRASMKTAHPLAGFNPDLALGDLIGA